MSWTVLRFYSMDWVCECDLFVERINSDSKVFEAIKPPLDNFFKMAIFPKLFCDIQNQENTASASHTADKYCHCKGPEQVKMVACDNSNCTCET